MNSQPIIIVKQLDATAAPAILRHMLGLTPTDLRMRFGAPQKEASVRTYVDRIDFLRDSLFGVYDSQLELVGLTHVGIGDAAEFGVSVLPKHRGRGLGTALFARAEEHARNRVVRTFFVHTLTENRPMLAIARKRKMQILTEAGEADCYLKLPRPDVWSMTSEFLHERVALCDFVLKVQAHAARAMAKAYLPRQSFSAMH